MRPGPLPRARLNPFLLRRAIGSGIAMNVLCRESGWTLYSDFFICLHSEKVIPSAKRIARLRRLAELIDFPLDEIFLDDPSMPQQADVVEAVG